MRPLLKWPGSKRRVAPELAAKIAPHLNNKGRYVELFAGSASVLFELEPERSVLVDTCKPLIAFYEGVKREPDAIYDELQVLLDLEFGEETFRRVKTEWNGHDFGVKFAARLIYLNKLCFNGLFRLNRKLMFNVAWGKKKKLPAFPDRKEFLYAASVLSRTKLYVRDYSRILRATHAGDVVYADPPYWGTYDRYAGGNFTEKDQRNLARMLRRASERGVTVFTSNVDCEEVRQLYESWSELEIVPVNHIIGCTKESRRKVNEVLVSATAPFVDKNQLTLFSFPSEAVTDGVSSRA
jgi:DNA adenine methylase